MADAKAADKAVPKKDGEDLTTILDSAQRAELTLLIASITDAMRNVLLDNFNAEAGLEKPLSTEGMTEDEKLMSADPKTADVGAMDKQKQLKDKYEKELSAEDIKELKGASLQAFDEWREQVLVRIGEVVNNREAAKKQLASVSSTETKQETSTTIGKIIETPFSGTSLKFRDVYPPTKNSLTKLSMEHRTLVLHSVLLLMLSLERYSAASRVMLLFLTSSLKLPVKTFEQDENATAKGLLEGVKELSGEEEKNKRIEDNKGSLKWKVGFATAAGAALIGVTGGLAAPLIAAGVGSLMGGLGLGATTAATYLGSLAGSTYLVGGLFGAYGGRMTGNMMDNYAREVQDFEFIPVHGNKKTSENEKEAAKHASDHDHKLRVTICISGWLTEKDEVSKPWTVLGTSSEVFALKYELAALMHLGNALYGFVSTKAWSYARKEIIARTILAGVWSAYVTAIWPITIIKTSKVLDNPFNIAMTRSEKAGMVLADALVNKAQGERPVTLIGYSLGAKVIYHCLKELAKRKAFGLVENAVLVGSPIAAETSDWRMMRTVVSGRLINVYSQNDYILAFMYRSASWQLGVAGLQAIPGLAGVENVDVSDEVNGHLKYRYLMGSLMQKIGFEDVDLHAVEKEKEALAHVERSAEEQEKAIEKDSAGGKGDDEEEAEQEADELEKEIEARTQASMAGELKKAGDGSDPSKDQAKIDDASALQSQSYVSRAAGWLPSVSKGWMPSLPTRGKPQHEDQAKQS